MKRALLAFLLFLTMVGVAEAHTPCTTPPVTATYGQQFQNTAVVQGFMYDVPNQIMWTNMRTGLVNWYFQVSQSVAQAFSNVQNLGSNISGTPDHFYQTQVINHHWGFLTETCNELITPQGSYLWQH